MRKTSLTTGSERAEMDVKYYVSEWLDLVDISLGTDKDADTIITQLNKDVEVTPTSVASQVVPVDGTVTVDSASSEGEGNEEGMVSSSTIQCEDNSGRTGVLEDSLQLVAGGDGKEDDASGAVDEVLEQTPQKKSAKKRRRRRLCWMTKRKTKKTPPERNASLPTKDTPLHSPDLQYESESDDCYILPPPAAPLIVISSDEEKPQSPPPVENNHADEPKSPSHHKRSHTRLYTKYFKTRKARRGGAVSSESSSQSEDDE